MEDSRKILSKNQIQKIKVSVGKYIQEHGDGTEKDVQSFLTKEILPSIHYSDETNPKPYNRISYRTDNESGHIIVSFDYQAPEDLRQRLRTQLKVKTSLRKTSEDLESQLWKRYAMLKKYARANVRIPTPDEVRQERSVFEQILDKVPNSEFKTFLEDCLA